MKFKSMFPLLLAVLMAIIVSAPCLLYADTVYDIHKEIPLRFNYRAANTGGFEVESPWIWLGSLLEASVYFNKMNVPTAISIPAKMTVECSKGEIYPGNMTACRAWIESQDDPSVSELWSNYGYTLGVKFRDVFTETELADVGKDFAMKIDEHGAMPLGTNLICGIDYLDYASFPVDEFIPDTETIQKVAKKIVGAAGIGTVRLVGELVLEGNYVELHIADATIKFYGFRDSTTYPDPASDPNVKTFALTIPSVSTLADSDNYNAESRTLFYEPIIQYSLNLYNSAGLEFSLIGPLRFNWLPKGENVLSYSCPDATTVHNGSYYNKVADDFKISAEKPMIVSFPLTDTPNLPDIAVTEVRFNNVPDGDIYADEWTSIDFTITNIGERDTVSSPEPLFTYSLFFNGQPAPDSLDPASGYTMLFRWLDDVPQDLYKTTLVSLPKNASHVVGSFVYKFSEGSLKLEISTGYNEYKTTQGGHPVYGIGDYHVANNYKVARQLYVKPRRGTVLGRIETNPCGGDCGVNDIKVCLKDTAAGGYYECQVTRNIDGPEGAYRFEKVPTGDYTLEYLPTPPTAKELAGGEVPYYAPRSFSFHHDGAATDDFNYNVVRSGMAIYQYQTLKGYVTDTKGGPIQGVTVQLGITDVGPFGQAVTTAEDGSFTFERGLPVYDEKGRLISSGIPPTGDYSLTLLHDLYQPKEIYFHLSVEDSTRKETVVTNSYFDPEVNPGGSTSGPVIMTVDKTAPTLTINPLANDGYGNSTLNLQFLASDTNGKEIKQYRYTVYYGISGTDHGTASEWFAYPDLDADNPDALVTAAVNIGGSLADGQHRLYVEVSDGRNVTGAFLNFTKDTTAAVISSLTLKDPVSQSTVVTNSKFVDASITLSTTEAGRLAAYLSNDNVTWSDPFYFTCTTPCTTTIGQWQVLFKDATTAPETHTVYAKVVDAAGNEGTVVSDTISVDSTGAVVLAGGDVYYNNSVSVPLSVDIAPPEGTLIASETGAGAKINIGDTADTQYRAQKITMDSAKTFNFIKIFMSYDAPPPVTGTPGPLHIKLVSQLPADDPSVSSPGNASLILAQWSFTAAEVTSLVREHGSLYILLPTPMTLSAGSYYLLMYTEAVDAASFYSKATGYYSLYSPTPENHERYDFVSAQSAWLPQRDIMSINTLSYEFWDNQQGEIRIAANGDCGSLTEDNWIAYTFPAMTPRTVDFSGIDTGSGAGLGLQTVCVEYRHPTISTRDGLYYDTVIIDTAAPTGTVQFHSVEEGAKTLYLDLDSTDSDVEFYTWRAGGTWAMAERYSKTLRIPNISVDTVEVKFIDRAGNESSIYTVTLPQDIFAPYLVSFQINDGTGYTTNPQLAFQVNAVDERDLAKIVYAEMITGTEGEIAVTGTTYNPATPDSVALPQVNVNGTDVWLDGIYQYVVQVQDAAGNLSVPHQVNITLDREAPAIVNFYLKGLDDRAFTTVPAFRMVLDCRDDFGPLQMRYSFDNSTWTTWQAIEQREITLDIDAPTPVPASYTLYLQVKDGAGNTTTAQADLRTNRPPATPVGGTPNGTVFTASPRIQPGTFSDADGDSLEAIWLIVRKADDQTVIVNTLPLYGTDGYTLDLSVLFYDVSYTWSARYLDSFGQWSAWSSPVTFVLKRPTLTVNRTGNGKVMSSGGQIDCGSDCSEVYDPASNVVLTATPDSGYVFAGWTGDCTGKGTCNVTMTQDRNVTATFIKSVLYASFTGSGIWEWNGNGWTLLTPDNPEAMVASGTDLYGDFGGSGLWQWNGSGWSLLTPDNPSLMIAADANLYASFTGAGIWQWNGSGWSLLTPDNPESMVASGADLYGDFGGNGLWQWNGSGWSLLTPDNPEAMIVSGTNLYGDFGGSGLWQWNGSGWSQLTPDNPEAIVASGTDLYGDFGGNGLWQWNGSGWSLLTPDNPEDMVASEVNLYGDFGGSGLWQWNGSGWTLLTPDNPAGMVIGN